MTFKEALHGISKPKYFKMVGYSYNSCDKYADYTFSELPKDYQDGIIVLICDIYNIQKMVYNYELELVVHYMRNTGIICKPFFIDCNITPTFWRTLCLKVDRVERLMVIRMELIKILNRLFAYVNQSQLAS